MAYKISICIPTYKRPEMLEKLICSMASGNIDPKLVEKPDVIVVDNDIEMSAKDTVENIPKRCEIPFELKYYNYPVKGLAHVRNELLNRALSLDPDFIVFVDDDEHVSENWLNELVLTMIEKGGDAARGPVLAEPVVPVSRYISALLERENYEDGTLLRTWTTGNLIVKVTTLRKHQIRFDARFNATGSEDNFFGRQLTKRGASIFWSKQAITFETLPEKRTKLSWFIRRHYRGGYSFMYILKIEKEYFKVIKKIIVSFVYIGYGLVSSFLLLFPIKKKYKYFLKLFEGLGGIAGVFNFKYNEYR